MKMQSKSKAPEDDGKHFTRARRKIQVTNSASSASSKCNVVDDNTLHPTNGKLSCRLDNSLHHFPEKPTTKRPRCQLHRWARNRQGKEVIQGVSTCLDCQVNLCKDCWKWFHTESCLSDKKEFIANL